MGEEEEVTEATEVVENGTAPQEKDGESATEKKEEVQDGVKEMEEDCKDEEKVETTKMDVDKSEAKEINEGKTKEETELKGSNDEEKEGKEEGEHKGEAMDEENVIEEEENVNEESEDKVENAAGLKVAEEKVSKKHGKAKTAGENVNNKKKAVEEKKEKEQKTPVTPAIKRPVRERKSVERLVATIERDAVKKFHIGKGRGTALKDIPNVAYKLSKKKTDETCRLLHTILYGRRGKAPQVKTNISGFSGFVWHENEDKQKIKIQEKFDKFVKEKLLEFCDVLDLPIAKATTRKEDIVTKLIDFLVAPYATTTVLLAEKEQSIKGKKRKRLSRNSSSTSGSTPSSSLKSRKRIENASNEEEKSSKTDPEEEYGEEQEDGDEDGRVEQENVNGVPEGSEDVKPEHAKSEEKETESEAESEEDTRKRKQGSKNFSARKNSSQKAKITKIATPKKSSSPKKAHFKSSSSRSKVEENNDISPKTFSRKKKKEIVNQKSTTPKKNVSKEKTGKKVAREEENPKEEKLRPSDDELKNVICEILKEVDFNTATFTDILKLLAKRYNTDLTLRKSSIKLMIQDELTKLADEADNEEEGDDVRDEKPLSDRGVKA